jgi:DNA polymerase III subunit delta'
MSFRSEEIVKRFESSHRSDRLGHAYLLTGGSEEAVDSLAHQLATYILGGEAEGHPDFYRVRPESKSRRITVEQMRDLEKSLYLKPFKAPCKVAIVSSAERMCLGQAEAANAFLKTLEEPPNGTLLLMCSVRPQLLLPTIISRCLRLDLLAEANPEAPAEMLPFFEKWFSGKAGPVRVYARASALTSYWQQIREKLEDRELPGEEDGVTEEALKALIEGEFQLARQETLANLQREYWKKATHQETGKMAKSTLRAIIALEELQQSLQFNIDQNLAVERACLKIEGQI